MSNKTFEKRKKIIYDFICDDMYVPMKFKEMAMVLQVNKEQRDELRQVLESLEEEGKICLSKRGKYCKGEAKRLQGTYRANQRGFGFVIIPEEDQDIFIGEDDAGGALDGDTVEVIITKASDRDGKRREGKIVKIVERGLTTVVGLYQKKGNKSYGFVIPDNQRILQDIFIPEGKSKEAVDGHKVVVELTSYGEKGRSPEGRIVEIIGHVNHPGTDIMSIVKGYDLPVEFPEKVLNQAERVSKPVSEADMQGRKDIRDWQMVTIDGEDAKDLDDAVSLYMDGDNYVLGVHIADVSNYVQEHSAEEIAKCIAPQFAETGSDTLTAIVARYQEQDTWKKDLIFHKDAFDLLQNIREDSDVLKERVPYEKLVTTEFSEKAAAK